MKINFKNMFICILLAMLLCLLAACHRNAMQSEPVIPSDEIIADAPTPSDAEKEQDKPTIPENVAEGIDYLYDFRFSERYDDRVTDDFSLVLSGESTPKYDTLFLFGKYQNEMERIQECIRSGDGMVPYLYKRYWYAFNTGDSLVIETDYYEPDGVEYISYIWTDMEGAKTNQGIAVGSTAAELLSAYTDDLYYLEQEQTESSLVDEDAGYNFDYAYAWQPYSPETNDIRDITFYIADGKVAAIEMTEPYELRYVYGYDRDAGLQYTAEQRAK